MLPGVRQQNYQPVGQAVGDNYPSSRVESRDCCRGN